MKGKWFLTVLFLAALPAVFAQEPAVSVPDTNAIKILFFAGLRDKLKEDYARAGESFSKIIALDPENAPANYELAVINFRQNKPLEAEIAIRKAVAIDANNLWYWRLLSELYKRKGDMDALVKVFNQMIRLSPDDDSFYFDRANAYLLAGKTEEALKSYDELEKKFGSSEALIRARTRAGKEKTAGPELMGTGALEAAVTSEQAMLIEGEKLFKQGDLNGALIQFKAILKITDQLYAAWEHTMAAEIALAAYKDAIKTGEEALSLYPSQAGLYYQMAVALMNDGQHDQALSNIKTAMQLDEGNALVLECYGDVLFLKGDKEAALLQWKKAQAGGNNSGRLKKKINEKKYIK
ncbi:MAG TPA: tetratricopeptide repeat protein [Pedobacter sp.]|uniref:tetratricopeptide repeat protein n=1 Tax=Pedobacter sp. TaxID=1411316 RepID=UPI002C4F1DBB|nr:tetratricopeptide repeat protein [Pedobacter sp.]HMI01591.1 tetratricopeptide repeat protein [Pedobacter sp.]